MIIPIPLHIVGICEGYNYALGLEESGGMVRVGPVHYNTLEEIKKFGEVLRNIIGDER
jgi:selenocysteine lyase/cysteine desulfurase